MNLIQRIRQSIAKSAESVLYRLYPELASRQTVSGSLTMTGWGQGMGFRQAAEAYGSRVWVNKAVRVIASNISPLEVQVLDADDQPIEGHPLAELFARPNPSMTAPDLWEQWVTDLMLGGEIGFELVKGKRGGLVQVWPRTPDVFAVRIDPQTRRYGGVLGYPIDDLQGEPYFVPADEFIHFRFHNPMNAVRGLAPIAAVRMGIQIDALAQAWAALFFKNGARPDFAIITPQGLTQTERENMLARFLAERQGIGGAHLPMVLEEGITDVKPFSFPPRDTEWLAQREMSRDEIGAIFGVPDEIMGYGRDTYENFGQAKRVFWDLTLLSLIRKRDADLTAFFQRYKMLDLRHKFATNLANVSELHEDRSAKIAQARELWAMGVPFNSINETLELGFDPIEGGDVGYIPLSLVPVRDKIAEPEEPADTEPAATEEDPPEDPPAAEDPEQESDAQPAKLVEAHRFLDALFERTEAQGKTKAASVPEYGSDRHKAVWYLFKAKTESHESEFIRMLKKAFQEQQDRINERVRAGKAVQKFSLGALFDLAREIQRWIDIFNPFFRTITTENGQAAIEFTGQAGVNFDLGNPQIAQGLDQMVWDFSNEVNLTTQAALQETLAQADAEGWGIPQLSEQISDLYSGFKGYRSELIARTEIIKASNFGTMNGYRQAGVGKKSWLTAIDERTRQAHIAAHGQVVAMDEAFEVDGEMLMFPGDPSASPSNVCNCRCTIYPVME